MTWPSACTPASVRPAVATRTRRPSHRWARTASSSPWTVRAPGCSWNPAKSVPSYSTRARYRTEPPSRAILRRRRPREAVTSFNASCRADPALHQLQLDDLGAVAGPLADPNDARVARGAIRVLRRDLAEQLVDHERLVG